MNIYELGKIPTEKTDLIGGKARGLNALKQLDFKIPEGFIIENIESTDEIDFDKIVEAYKERNMGIVAVRSSANLEDGNDYSSAGQFSTILNVCSEDNLKKAVKECIDSLQNTHAQEYVKTFLRNKELKMTVVVQNMINAKMAGVIFTKDPDNKDNLLIEVVNGLGENLVSGAVSAEQYRVNRSTKQMISNENTILTTEQVELLTAQALSIEEKLGFDCDLEYAFDQNNDLYWLQVRPITIKETPTISEFNTKAPIGNDILTTCNIREMMPGAVTPLGISTNMYALDWSIRKVMCNVGYAKRVEDTADYSCIVPVDNHMFMNLSNIYRMCHCTYGAYKEAVDLSICGKVLNDYPDVEMKSPFFLKRIKNTFVYLDYTMSAKKAKKGITKIADSFDFDYDKDIEGLYEQATKGLPILNQVVFYHYCSSFYSGAQCNISTMMLEKKFKNPNDLQAKMAGALTEINNIESADILKSMQKIVACIKEECPEAINYSSLELQTYLDNPGPKTKKAYDEFMQKHGHRGIVEPEIRRLPFSRDKKMFAENIYVLLKAPETNNNDSSAKHWEDYSQELLKGYKGLKKRFFGNFIKNARKGVYYREYTKAKYIYVFDKFKKLYAILGDKLYAANILPDADCIYFLTHQEIGQLINGDISLIKKAIARRRLYNVQLKLKFPEYSLGIPSPINNKDFDMNAKCYEGTPVSCGVVTGKARIINSIEDANQLMPGEIMVASFTDIGWSPYYGIAGGLITEIGSALSHGIVVAREYALPAVVNIQGALTIIKTGDTITLDGNSGKIYIVRD